MAEGIQMESLSPKFFCHHCRRAVSLFHTADLICPDCSSGFLEEVSKELQEAEEAFRNSGQSGESEEESDNDESSNWGGVDDDVLNMMLSSVSVRRHPEGEFSSTDYYRPNIAGEEFMFGEQFRRSDSVSDITAHPHLFNDFDAVAESELMRLRIGHWNDYDIDDEVDVLTAQLLDDVELSGPPPLSKEQIKAIAVVSVSREQVEKEMQCTICMEDLSVREKVKSLSCAHLYHEKCITPWLERQATCPNCRNVIEIQQPKCSKDSSSRSRSCPRAQTNSHSGSRRFSEMSGITEYFNTNLNPFRFLN